MEYTDKKRIADICIVLMLLIFFVIFILICTEIFKEFATEMCNMFNEKITVMEQNALQMIEDSIGKNTSTLNDSMENGTENINDLLNNLKGLSGLYE